MVMFIYMPETPRYLVRRGQIKRARRVVRKWIYRTSNGEVDKDVVVRKVKLLELYNSEEHPNWSTYRRFRKTLKELYLVPGHFRAWIVACGLQGIQQLCGFNSLMYFSAIIFQVIGFNKPTAVLLIVAETNMAFTILAFVLIDIVGRRRILLCTIWGMAAALVLNIAFHFLPPEATQSNSWAIIILIAMMVYVAFYVSGIDDISEEKSFLL
ncbi:general substrate transporter [Lipomyces tetrasporus]|uniref:General substrate transporter n=1 Tax=Lipomyces tetrasporus TaxID=54092 RepID=A0AAD7QNI0_9ASCO|nr:general substrate transporter [Lipomyces tetrasporus]KAJ8098106.1 general substrate transporter [Lipomyces tetrasporus]